MKSKYTTDPVLKKLLQQAELKQAPEHLKKGILLEIEKLPVPQTSKYLLPGIPVLVSVGLILLASLMWALYSLPGESGVGLQIHPIQSISGLDQWLIQAGLSLNQLFDFNLNPNAQWLYYAGAGILIVWFYFLMHLILDRLTHSGTHYAA